MDLPLVGREAELAAMTAALAPGRGPRALVLVGEAGVGKTRLVTEAIRQASLPTLSGGCLPLAASVPFLPLTEALRELDPAALDRCAPYVRTEVARLIPAWGTAPSGRADDWEQGRLFAAVRDLLATTAPQALVIEDIHWADASTLDFLAYHHAVDRAGATPMVLTCREEETDAILGWLSEFARRPDVRILPLPRLSRDEVAQHIGALLGRAPALDYVGELYDRAEGNAFFTEQLVAAGGEALPDGLAQLLIARAEAVGPEARRTLRTLALAGRPIDEDALAGPGLRGSIRQLIAAWLVERPDAAGRYRLRHALVGEVVTAAMTPGERREGHARLARRLERSGAAPGEIAEHWAAAGVIHEEAPWRFAAARAAEDSAAFREAATHLLRLIELSARMKIDDLPDLYVRALDALDRCGDGATATTLADEAVRVLAAELDRPRLALLYERVATYRWLTEEEAALPILEAALELLAGLPPGRELAVVLHSYGTLLADMGRIPEGRPVLERALETCEIAGLTVERIKVMRDLARFTMIGGDRARGWTLMDGAVDLAERHGDPVLVAGVAQVRAISLIVHGQLEEAAASAGKALAEVRRAGLDRHYTAEFLAGWYFHALHALGRPEEAAAMLPASTEATAVGTATLARAFLEILSGDRAAAVARLAETEKTMSPVNFCDPVYLWSRGEIDLWLGRPAEALSRMRGIPGGISVAVFRPHASRLFRIAAQACADLAEAARAEGDQHGVEQAQRAAADLVADHAAARPDPFAPHPSWVAPPAEGAAWHAELTRVAGRPDPEAWADAVAAWQRLGEVHRVAYARWHQAEALLATGKRAEAGRLLSVAARAAHNHAPLLAGIQETARLARLSLRDEPAVQPPSSPYGLTARETAVLALVAEGLTNVQIGRRLFISESTVSVHLTNLMRKLGVSNRAQAAARGQRAGLIS